MNIFKKLLFLINKPCVIVVVGRGRACAKEAILKTLRLYIRKQGILIFESNLENSKEIEDYNFLMKNSKTPILVATHIGEIPPDKDFFGGEGKDAAPIIKLARDIPFYGYLVLNFDDETVREIKNKTMAHCFSFGFQKGADFQATDINLNLEGMNLKVNYQEKTVPFWLKDIFGKEQIYSALASIAVGVLKNINLVEISQSLKSYHSLPGKMGLVPGIKKTLIIDDTENATVFSMIEALGILGELGRSEKKRKIAVLGDVLGIGRYSIEAHETIGERANKNSDLLFTFGSRAKFIAQGARNKGMNPDNIFEFNTIKQGELELQKQIKKGDIILIDGSKEMKMGELVKEIKSIEQ